MIIARVVLFHTDGHSIWLAPWFAKTLVVLIGLWVVLAVLNWMRS